MDRRALAHDLFINGCNCSQAVFCAFEDIIGLDHNTALKISSGFGGGIGRLRETCGAVSGMIMAANSLYGYSDISDLSLKSEHYRLVQRLCKSFSDEAGSIVCRDLLGIKGSSDPVSPPRTDDFYNTRPCLRLVMLAAQILDDYIKERQHD